MRNSRTALASCLVLAAGMMYADAATAQFTERDNRRKERNSRQGSVKKAVEAPLFPQATRQEPDPKPTQEGIKKLQEIGKAYDAQDFDAVLSKAAALAASTGNAYETGMAMQYAAVAATEKGDLAGAERYLQQVIDSNSLSNNNHYRAMHNLAAIQAQREEHAKSLATLDRLIAETKTDDEKYATMRASLLANAGKNDEAAAAFIALSKKHPEDKRYLMNAVATLQQADKFNEASALLQDARKRGLLTEAKEYRALYSGLLNAEQWKAAAEAIDEGAAKGILPKDDELAKAYSVTANRAYFAEDLNAAARYYAKAAEFSKTGEEYLNLAKIYDIQKKPAEARAAAQKALAKGVGNKAEATRLANKK